MLTGRDRQTLQLPSTVLPAIKRTYLICKQEEQCLYKGRSACRQVQGRYSCAEGVSRICHCQLQQDMVAALKAEAQRFELGAEVTNSLCYALNVPFSIPQ